MKFKVIVNCNVIGFGRAVVGQEIELNSTAENHSLMLNGSLELIENTEITKADIEQKKVNTSSTKSKTTK